VADKITFTRSSGERIAKVVRIVEGGNRDTVSLPTSPRFAPSNIGAVKFCSWTATWQHGSTTLIRFDPVTAQTATATNVILGVGPGDGWVSRKGAAGWQLIGFDMTKQVGYLASETQLFGHDASALCQWYSIVSCSTATTEE